MGLSVFWSVVFQPKLRYNLCIDRIIPKYKKTFHLIFPAYANLNATRGLFCSFVERTMSRMSNQSRQVVSYWQSSEFLSCAYSCRVKGTVWPKVYVYWLRCHVCFITNRHTGDLALKMANQVGLHASYTKLSRGRFLPCLVKKLSVSSSSSQSAEI